MGTLSPTDVDATVHEVFQERPFVADQNMWDAAALLKAWWSRFGGDLYFTDPGVFWLVLVLLCIALVLLLWHVGLSMRLAWHAFSRAADVAAPTEIAASVDLTSAHAALGQGKHRQAIELAWVAFRHGLGDEAGLTPRQLARVFAPRLPVHVAREFMALVRTHEAVCYAGQQPTADQAKVVIGTVEKLMEFA